MTDKFKGTGVWSGVEFERKPEESDGSAPIESPEKKKEEKKEQSSVSTSSSKK